MDELGVARLREHFRKHNQWVLGLMAGTIVVTAALWVALYWLTWWLFILGGTALESTDFHPEQGPVMRGFAAVAILMCGVAWVLQLMRQDARVKDRRGVPGHILDLVLMAPRMTISVFGTGRAVALLNDDDLRHAWRLLQRMRDARSAVPVQTLPLDIPDSTMRNRIILALQLSGVIDVRAASTGPVLAFKDDKARELALEKVRLRV